MAEQRTTRNRPGASRASAGRGADGSAPADALRQAAGDTEVKVAAAALAAAFSPPLGVALAAGAALRSPRFRDALRRGTVQALAGAMRVGDQLTGEHAREDSSSG